MKYKAVDTVWIKKKHEWVCKYCKQNTKTIYVVTGHDHTDSSITICNCGEGTSIQEKWESNHYARDNCPVEYED